MLGEDETLLGYAFPFSNRAVVQARGTRTTRLQPPQLKQAEGRPRHSFPRLVCKDITTKPGLNSHPVTCGKPRGIYVVAVLVVVCGCSVEGSRKCVSGHERGEGNV